MHRVNDAPTTAIGSDRAAGRPSKLAVAEGYPGPSGAYTVLSTGSIRHSAATRSSLHAVSAAILPPREWPRR